MIFSKILFKFDEMTFSVMRQERVIEYLTKLKIEKEIFDFSTTHQGLFITFDIKTNIDKEDFFQKWKEKHIINL